MNYKLHLSTEFHVYNTKRRIAELAPITEDVFDEKKAQMVSANQSAMTEVTFKCHPCNKTFKSIEMLDQHKKSKNHKKNEKAYVAANPNVSESSMFKSISHTDKSETASATGNILDGIDQESEQTSEPLKVKESCKTTLDSLRICLFCNKESDGVKKNIDHMRIKHSFTILDVDCLVDLKGMLTYMASRIQMGHLCLFCSKQFKEPMHCQQHMIDSCHCIMNMEDEDEYVDFYDFSKTYENHPLIIQGEEKKALEPIKEEKGTKKDDEWEDCDYEDMNSDDAMDEIDPEDIKMAEAESGTSSFDIVDKPISTSSIEKPSSSSAFSIVDKPETDEVSSVEASSNKGKSKTELGLKVKKAERLHTGEVRLGNGKIMGVRKFHYIYKQKPRVPDTREAVVINKIALEYRRMRAIENGTATSSQLMVAGPGMFPGMLTKKEFIRSKVV